MEEHRPQFQALCRGLKLDLEASDILATFTDLVEVPWPAITDVIDSDILSEHGTFRGCLFEAVAGFPRSNGLAMLW